MLLLLVKVKYDVNKNIIIWSFNHLSKRFSTMLYLFEQIHLPYSELFSNQKFLHKCLNINFGGFNFRSQYIRSIAVQLFVRNDVT